MLEDNLAERLFIPNINVSLRKSERQQLAAMDSYP
jgi:hypothetical protein